MSVDQITSDDTIGSEIGDYTDALLVALDRLFNAFRYGDAARIVQVARPRGGGQGSESVGDALQRIVGNVERLSARIDAATDMAADQECDLAKLRAEREIVRNYFGAN